ncbi:hypothetical protein [Pedobacter foliorum]
MQPTDHMKESEDELIAHIRESLLGHEEEYVPGSWENFNKNEGKKTLPVIWLWRLSSAAAVLLVVGAGIMLFKQKATVQVPVQNVQLKPQESSRPSAEIETVKETPVQIEPKQSKNAEANTARVHEASNILAITSDETIIVKENTVVTSAPAVETKVIEPVTDVAKTQANPTAIESKALGIQDFLNNETRKNQGEALAKTSTNQHQDKWEMGLVVSPSFGNTKKLNMGYGISMGYALTDKISLNSGVSYSEMAATKNLPATVSSSFIANGSKNLESIEAKISGIDIPLEIKYHVSKNLYANVGVSAFAVINQKQSNSYIQEKVVERAVNSDAGLDQLKTFAINERVVEQAPESESEIKDGRYIGFYNFSFGYKQKISKGKAVSIEPFMKVPMKEVSKENLRLIGTGVRLKLDF